MCHSDEETSPGGGDFLVRTILNKTVRLAIADDDIKQSEYLSTLVGKLRSNWQITSLATDLEQLRLLLTDVVPDILLLDLHMPGVTSELGVLDVIRASDSPPVVILVTGDASQALRAYEDNVTDYLVKPVRPSRLDHALRRAEDVLLARKHTSRMVSPANELRWLTGVRGRDVVFVDPDEVIYFQAERKYTTAISTTGQVLLRRGITDIEALLSSEKFIRIHRSTNVKFIEYLRRDEMGKLGLHLRGKSVRLIVSRSFEQAFKET